MRRAFHTAWTPPSLPNSIVLLGGVLQDGSDNQRNAEIVPGVKTKPGINHFARWQNIQLES